MRVINGSNLNNFISGEEKIMTLYSYDYISLPPAECIFKAGDKTFIINKFNPYFEGGPLFYHLKNSGTFNEQKTKIIAAQIINIILFAHKKKINLNFSPENFILDKNGFVNYLWFEIEDKIFLEKCKPEILKPLEYSQINNDWYNLGILIYEMLFHNSPLNYLDSYGSLHYPKFIGISDEAKEFIEKLLCMTNEQQDLELEDIKKFKFFENINFDDVINRKIESGIVPMNLDIQKMNNMGIITDDENQKDQAEEMEKDRYTLFNYDSNDENDDE
jgi:serine/threonine protein kinase